MLSSGVSNFYLCFFLFQILSQNLGFSVYLIASHIDPGMFFFHTAFVAIGYQHLVLARPCYWVPWFVLQLPSSMTNLPSPTSRKCFSKLNFLSDFRLLRKVASPHSPQPARALCCLPRRNQVADLISTKGLWDRLPLQNWEWTPWMQEVQNLRVKQRSWG